MARKTKIKKIYISVRLLQRAGACPIGAHRFKIITGQTTRTLLTRALLMQHVDNMTISDVSWLCQRYLKGEAGKLFIGMVRAYYNSGADVTDAQFKRLFLWTLAHCLNLPLA